VLRGIVCIHSQWGIPDVFRLQRFSGTSAFHLIFELAAIGNLGRLEDYSADENRSWSGCQLVRLSAGQIFLLLSLPGLLFPA
jgi:hypothetical protein